MYAYGLLASGHVDAVIEADLKPYDYMALVPIVKGAGGEFTDWRGEELRWQGSAEALASGDFQGEVIATGTRGRTRARSKSWRRDAIFSMYDV